MKNITSQSSSPAKVAGLDSAKNAPPLISDVSSKRGDIMDITTISAAYTGLKIAKDVFTGLAELKIETESLDKINDAVKKVGDAQDALFQLREELFKLQEENNSLRKEMAEYEAWDKKLDGYELVKTEGNAVVYKSKAKPEHYLCPSCISKKSIEILQDNRAISGKFRCIGCEGEYPINPKEKMKPLKFDNGFV